jgi:tRNA A37 N6-isopentenylltransferase MiaA
MKEDIIRMAREAGWHDELLLVSFTMPLLERFFHMAQAAEREACAKVCDRMVMYGLVAEVQQRYNKAYADCRDAIRARGQA